MADAELGFLHADWPAPAGVYAGTTTRAGGVSTGAFASLNLGAHVGDAPEHVAENRRRLRQALRLPGEPQWLRQVHGTDVVYVPHAGEAVADGSWTDRPGVVCAVLSADCLPVLLCDESGERVGAVHAGWRGLCAGALEAAVAAMSVPPERLLAWLGPAIGPSAFEVGPEVREAFVAADAMAAEAFRANRPGHWLADLYLLARQRLQATGVERIYGGGHCTLSEAERFYSYRRDGQTGRMASIIWRE